MRGTTAHPGVNLYQRSKAGAWFIRYFDIRSGERVQMSKSTLTDDHDIATRIAKEVFAFLGNRDLWDAAPVDWHPRTYELLCVEPHDDVAKKVGMSLRILAAPARIAGIDATPTLQRAQKGLATMQEAMDKLRQERDEWKRRAIAAESQLSKMGKKANKSRAALEGVTLADALETWSKTLTGDADYVSDQQNTAGMFVRQFGEKALLIEMVGQESDIDLWIRNIKRAAGKRKGQPITAGRRQEIRRVVLRFLRESGAEADGKVIKRPSIKDVRNDRGAIRWLTKEHARSVAAMIKEPYFADCFKMQLALGLRPDELLTLKKADFSEIDGAMTLTLSPLDHLTLKEGSRTVIVPEQVREIVARRLAENPILFPYRSKRNKTPGAAWPKAKLFDRLYLSALRRAGTAADVPFKLDCRIARRTCATLLLGAGVAPKAVADILGDRLDTVIEHYGAAIPGTNDPSKAAI